MEEKTLAQIMGIQKNFGFGCMRLPMKGEDIDLEETCRKMPKPFWMNFTAAARPAMPSVLRPVFRA